MSLAPTIVGVSLKSYFSLHRARSWARRVDDDCGGHPAVVDGSVGVFLLPSFLAVPAVRELLGGAPVRVGAQDVSAFPRGAHTGEVPAEDLAEAGCRYVAVGHAERRATHHEDDAVVAAKVAAALRHGLVPVLCVGEQDRGTADDALTTCRQHVLAALTGARAAGLRGDLVVAYEPVWAIGAAEPAAAEHVRHVCAGLQDLLRPPNAPAEVSGVVDDARVLYGGSAGPGLLTRLGGEVDGLFLGRFAHDPAAVRLVVEEAAALAAQEERVR